MEYANDFEVKIAQVQAVGGDASKPTNIYEADLEILNKLQQGLGAQIDDTTIALDKVWSSNKTNSMIATAGIQIEIVDQLPAVGEVKKIYLVPKTGTTGDAYDEYMWINNQWEKIGSTQIDLSNYYTKAQTDSAIATATTDMATKTWVGASYAKVVTLTQAQYDALATKDPMTLYIISDAQ